MDGFRLRRLLERSESKRVVVAAVVIAIFALLFLIGLIVVACLCE